MSENAVIIVAGGSGSRMKSDLPKQFIEIAGKPILLHTINRFIEFDPAMQVVLVLPEGHIERWELIRDKFNLKANVDVAHGGPTRYASVQNGMKLVQSAKVIGIHDGVRPLVSAETLEKCYSAAAKNGNAVPAIEINETIRQGSHVESHWVDRSQYHIVQTPQCFRSDMIQNAYEQPYLNSFTDDASVVENLGVQIHLVPGNKENIKITRPEDLIYAETLIQLKHGKA